MSNSSQPTYLDEKDIFGRWHTAFKQNQDQVWKHAKRGDWMMYAAEMDGVPASVLIPAAAKIVEEFLDFLKPEISARSALFELQKHWSGVIDRSAPLHWEGHVTLAKAEILAAIGHLQHGTGHIAICPALALHHCQVAALMAYPPGAEPKRDGREEGDKWAKELTAERTRELLPKPSDWRRLKGSER